ncbi:hypothetical protein [Bdellovibrio sp. ZAP7]|uniref:hypothetical protein n=1 Tax=Bdellovibrio sp. ZAP7 TaxID=2231053 RepID=UPI001FEFCDFF|nr:hypothetical protein [Bdellovibrio sp. ZAP7]
MESYKPQAAPWYQTVFKNPVVHVALLAALVGGGGFYLYQNNQSNTMNVASKARPMVQVNSSKNLPPPPPPAPEPQVAMVAGSVTETSADGATTVTSTDGNDADISKKLAAARAFAQTAAVKDETKKDNSTAATKGTGPHLTVIYAEVARPALGRLMDVSRGTGQFMNFADYSAGIIPGLSKRLQAPGIKVLHKEERNLDSNKTLQWSYGLKDRSNPSVEIGHTTFFEIADMDGANLRGNLEIQRTWREAGPTGALEIQRKSFPAIFEIGAETGFFMAGVMPTQSNLENDDELAGIDVYKILRSPQFRAGESEFVIFVEYDNK